MTRENRNHNQLTFRRRTHANRQSNQEEASVALSHHGPIVCPAQLVERPSTVEARDWAPAVLDGSRVQRRNPHQLPQDRQRRGRQQLQRAEKLAPVRKVRQFGS